MEFIRRKIKWTIHKHCAAAAATAKSLQSCPTLCDPIDGSPLGSSVPGILQSRILEWVAISFSNAWKWKVKVKLLSRTRLLATPWTGAYQAPPSMGISRQEYWSGVPLPSLKHWNTGDKIVLWGVWVNDSATILKFNDFVFETQWLSKLMEMMGTRPMTVQVWGCRKARD